MTKIYFAGLKATKIVNENRIISDGSILTMDEFTSISCEGLTDIEIGWDYLLLWKNTELYISGKIVGRHGKSVDKLLQIPNHKKIKYVNF